MDDTTTTYPQQPRRCGHCGLLLSADDLETAVVTWLETLDGIRHYGPSVTHYRCRWAWTPERSGELRLQSFSVPPSEYVPEKKPRVQQEIFMFG